ncbi:MAG: pyridoxamine 5'-phosphate oxidase family protein [Spongiibacteraceae bacterium]|jgi:adenylate cyclase|nr:pyridoxamine 5'-phosphate oxidase family protein [Spongiibacteraceae bacterium]
MSLCLDDIRSCLEGAVPATLASCDPDGEPNVSYVSQIHYLDARHVALTFQFFNKTRRNILANPQATALVLDPDSCARYRLALLYRHTETEGPVFASLKAKLAGIASHSGMAEVFRLQGADIYQVLDVERVPGEQLPSCAGKRPLLSAIRRIAAVLSEARDIPGLFDGLLAGVDREMGIRHGMVLLWDRATDCLFTVASRGYADTGIGAEIPLGYGVVGVAMAERTPIRIAHFAADYGYVAAMREHSRSAMTGALETRIPFPGLPQPRSQLAIPIGAQGILYVESDQELQFRYDDEDALLLLASLADEISHRLRAAQETLASGDHASAADSPAATTLRVRYYPGHSSVFIDDDYLIKGVAGAILWRLLTEFAASGRCDFSNRELRLDASLKLPDIDDNLESRLILLQRRVAERGRGIRLEKTGRGRFRLRLPGPLQLECVD